MTQTHEALQRYEEQLTRLYAQVGTVDPASAGFQALVKECSRCAAEIEREPELLAKAPAQLRRIVGLNALVQDAVRRERDGVAELIAQTRRVRASLTLERQPGMTGDSCDVRG